MRNSTFFAFLLLVTNASCGFAEDRTPVPVVTVAKGSHLESPTPTVVVLDAKEWKAAWSAWHKAVEPTPPLPEVDFSKETVVAVFAGEKPTTGWKIEVEKVERQGDDLVVTVREKGPPPGAMTGQALTYPYHIVRVPRVPGKIVFVTAEGGPTLRSAPLPPSDTPGSKREK